MRMAILVAALATAVSAFGSDQRTGRPEPAAITSALNAFWNAYAMRYYDSGPEAQAAFENAYWAFAFVNYAWTIGFDGVLDGSSSAEYFNYVKASAYNYSSAAYVYSELGYNKKPLATALGSYHANLAARNAIGATLSAPAPVDGLSPELRQLRDWHSNFRQSINLPRLRSDLRLNAAAQSHANWMAANLTMTHAGAGGTQPIQRATAQGYSGRGYSVAENIAFGQATTSAVYTAWLNSVSHRTNMVGAYQDIGIGVATAANGQRYWCVEFGVIVP